MSWGIFRGSIAQGGNRARQLRCHGFSVAVNENSNSLYGSGWDAGPREVKVAVWWDFEDCDIPVGVSATNVGNNIIAALRTRGFKGPVSINAYGDTWQLTRSTQQALASTGISLHHIPTSRKTSTSDRTLMVDIVLWTLDHPPPAHLFVVSTDSDLSSALHSLRMKNYNVLLACNSCAASPALLAAATSVWQWGKLARGEGLVPQTIVSVQQHSSTKEFLQDLSHMSSSVSPSSPPPLSPPPLPPPPPLSRKGCLEQGKSGNKDSLQDFHKDVCLLLQQAAASLNQKPLESLLASVKKDLQAGNSVEKERSSSPTGMSLSKDQVCDTSRATKEKVDVIREADSATNDCTPQEARKQSSSSCERSSEGSTDLAGEMDAKGDVVKKIATAIEDSSSQSHPQLNAGALGEKNAVDTSQSSSSGAVLGEPKDDGKWTWRKFWFGSNTMEAATSQAKSDAQKDDAHNEETGRPDNSDGEMSNQSPPKRSWLLFWRRTAAAEEDRIEIAWTILKQYTKTEEAATLLSKSHSQEEFTNLLRECGPACIRNWEENRVSELVNRLVLEKEIDALTWELSREKNSPPLKTVDDNQEPDNAPTISEQHSWETIKGHYPNLEELRIWMVYFLNVEQERKGFDVSHLKPVFKKHFGLPLNLSLFGCTKIKDLLNVMQDIVHVSYPKASVCMIRTRTAFRSSRVKPTSLRDYAPLLEDLFLEHPEGIPISMIKARFYSKFNCDIDHQKLGYPRLDKFLRAARKDIYARLDNVEQSVYVFIRRQEDEEEEEEEETSTDEETSADEEEDYPSKASL